MNFKEYQRGSIKKGSASSVGSGGGIGEGKMADFWEKF